MGGYLVNFSVYTMAMIGLIFFALMVYKKFSGDGFSCRKSDFLKVEEHLNIAPRKNLYVVRAGNERFLIAGDTDKTTLISKLNETEGVCSRFPDKAGNVEQIRRKTIEDLPDITSRTSVNESSEVLHRLAKRINR